MTVICEISDSRMDHSNSEDRLFVQSDYGQDVKLSFKGQAIVVNGSALKKAIDNCCNI